MFNVSCGKVKYRIKGKADQHTNRTWHNLEKTNGVPIQFFDPNNYRLFILPNTRLIESNAPYIIERCLHLYGITETTIYTIPILD